MTDDEMDILDIYRILRDELPTLLGVTIVFAALSIAAALLMTEYYRAAVIVTPVAENGREGGSAALARQFGGLADLAGINLSSLSSGGGTLATPYLKSRVLVEEFIDQNDLVAVVSPDEPTLWKATKEFVEDIRQVTVDQRTGVITVSVEWTDPKVAAEWANGLVALANERLRARALEEAERNIAYLNEQIQQTTVVGIQQAMFNLIESEMQTVMLANARMEYAFAVVDPAVAPEENSKPKRALMVILGTFLGGLVALLYIGTRRLARHLRERDLATR